VDGAIPHIMRHLGLTDGTLGIALLGAPAGPVAAMVLASYLIPKLGSRRVVQVALVGYYWSAVLGHELRAEPQLVEDRAENTLAAAALGLQAVRFTSAEELPGQLEDRETSTR
jgi:MFS family permease